jgi:type IV fimbrial biogenesis protein FimT
MFSSPLCKAKAGFTLLEMMIAVAVMAILTTLAAPSLRDFIMNTRLTGQANELMTDLMLARSEATKRHVPISVCAKRDVKDDKGVKTGEVCTNDWATGWMVVIDADTNGLPDTDTRALKSADGLTGANTLQKIAGTPGAITFTPLGIAVNGGSTLRLCDSRNQGRLINVTTTGRAFVTKVESNCAG